MPEYLAPAVYVEEEDRGPKPIEGVSTSTAGVVGMTERGPVGVPVLVTSNGEFQRMYGGYLNDAFNGHRYLPHAVEGYFTNGGKRLYVVRILDTDNAHHATFFLFDRGDTGGVDSVLLRSAAERSGTSANLPLIYVLDTAGAGVDDWVRVGNGSAAEYRQIAVAPAQDSHLTLSHPMALSHDAGADLTHLPVTPDGAFSFFTLVNDVEAGDTEALVLESVAGEAANLAVGQLIQIGGPHGEYHFVTGVVVPPATPAQAQLTFGAAIAGDFAAGAAATVIDLTGAPAAQSATDLDANGGSAILFSDDPAANYDDRSEIVIIDILGDREVRRLGTLNVLSLATGAYADYPGGSIVEVVAAEDDARLLTAAVAAGVSVLTLDAVGDIVAGQTLRVGAAGLEEDVQVQAVNAGALQVTLAAPLANAHNVDDPALVASSLLLADAEEGERSLAVANRFALEEDDLLRIGDGQDAEFIAIASIPSQSGIAPDLGIVVLEHPLALDHAAGTRVTRVRHDQDNPAIDVRTLDGAIAAATDTITLHAVDGIIDGQFLVVGAPGNQELAEVDAGGVDPVALTVQFTANLGNTPLADGDPVQISQPAYTLLGAEDGDDELLVTDGNGFNDGALARVTLATGETFFHVLSDDPVAPNAQLVELDRALERAHPAGAALVERIPLIEVEAIDAGSWGNRLRISVEDENSGLVSRTTLRHVVDATHVRLESPAGVESGTVLELIDQATEERVGDFLKVEHLDRSDGTLTLAAPGLSVAQQAAAAAAMAAGGLRVRSREFQLTIRLLHQPDPAEPVKNDVVIDEESYRYLSMDPRHSRYIVNIIGDTDGNLREWDLRPEGASDFIRVHDLADDLPEPARTQALHSVRLGPEALRDVLPNGRDQAARHRLAGGDDSVATVDDQTYIGVDAAEAHDRTGIHAFRNIDEISLVAAPGRTSMAVQDALISHCELDRYRFAVLDAPVPPNDSLVAVQTQRQNFDTKYAALYYPWLKIGNPYPPRVDLVQDFYVPPGGHVLGVMARTDIERGVHKAPANEVVRGILGLSRRLTKGEHDILNPSPVNINVIRDFRTNNRGIRVWGSRVITSDTAYKYVPVRRLLIFIEESLDKGLQWVVFEPNAEPLWARVRRSISDFLRVVWRNGALEGTTEEQAFFVKCDRTTMTQAQIDNGQLICIVGVAPVKPAEYVIVRIGLKTAEAES